MKAEIRTKFDIGQHVWYFYNNEFILGEIIQCFAKYDFDKREVEITYIVSYVDEYGDTNDVTRCEWNLFDSEEALIASFKRSGLAR